MQNKMCPRCQGIIADHLRLCPCGYDFWPQSPPLQSASIDSAQLQPVKQNAVLNTASGCLFGVIAGIALVAIGVILTATAIGAILGIPLIIVGIGMMGAGPVAGAQIKQSKAECPYCQRILTVNGDSQALNCPDCKQRVLVRNGRLIKTPTT